MKKKRVLFVGAFESPADGTVGGIWFACTTLVQSRLSEFVDWLPVDSTQGILPAPSLGVRFLLAVRRVALCVKHLVFDQVDTVLVFCPFMRPSLFEKGLICILAAALRRRVVLTIRSEIVAPERLGFGIRSWFRFVLSRCDCVLFQSQQAFDAADRFYGCKARGWTVIGNWVPVPNVMRDYVPHDRDSILFIGRLLENKRVSDIIDAIKILSDQGRECSLVVCGDGDQSARLKQQCKDLGISQFVDFRGWVDKVEKERAFASARAVALVSASEGLPNFILESMMRGIPIIATPVGGIPSLIEDGVNGVFVEPGSPSTIASAIDMLFERPKLCQDMSRRNIEKARECHSIDVVWPQVADLLGVESTEDTIEQREC